MTSRQRILPLIWAGVCLVAFAGLAFAVTGDRSPLGAVDTWGRRAEDWADEHQVLIDVLRVVEVMFGTIGMTVATLVLAVLLLLRGHRLTASFAVATMLAVSLLTAGAKVWLGRDRPDWQDPAGILASKSFPSGHASASAAFATILIVLAVIFVRRSGMRRAAIATCVAVWALVCADRVLLGRHYPTDVVAGSLLGVAVTLVAIALLDPWPRLTAAAHRTRLVDVVPSERRLTVILNPIKVESVGQFRALVTTMAAESGWSEPRWLHTTVEDPGTGMAEVAAVQGSDLVLVCGGDGTVREVCAELAGTGIPIGIIPAGTGNLLARNLQIPLYLRSAIDVALNGQDRAIDLVAVAGDGVVDTHFMVMAGMGFDAAIMEGVNDSIKKRIGWIAYVISASKSLMFPAQRVEISIDGGEFTRHRARTVVVGNVGFLQAGMPLLPDAAIDDGLLDVVILHPANFLSWVPLAARVLTKAKRTDDLVDRKVGATAVIRAGSDTPRQLDGDSIGPGRELRMEVVHGRVLARVPR